jgi:hypothetical protein
MSMQAAAARRIACMGMGETAPLVRSVGCAEPPRQTRGAQWEVVCRGVSARHGMVVCELGEIWVSSIASLAVDETLARAPWSAHRIPHAATSW